MLAADGVDTTEGKVEQQRETRSDDQYELRRQLEDLESMLSWKK